MVKYRRAFASSRSTLFAAGLTLAQCRLDQFDGIVAGPFGRPCDRADFAAVRIDQQRGRHAEGAADRLQVLKHLGLRIGVVGELADADVLQEGFRLVQVTGVDVHRHHLKLRAAEALLQRVERRHFLAAGHAPGGPQVEQHGAAAPMLQRGLLAGHVKEGEVRELQRALGNVNGGDLAVRQRRYFPGQFDRRPAGRVAARIAPEGGNPVYPRQPDDQAGDNARRDQGEPFFGG